jgi:putative acetyltransferase
MKILPVVESSFPSLVDVWEASVRATHDFLAEADLQIIKPRILNEFLYAVEPAAACDPDGSIIGFVGVADRKIEMLFVRPDRRGEGVGRELVRHAIARHGIDAVDVNEQNDRALGFYLRMGFRVVGRSERDGLGKPYPLLHMTLDPAGSPDCGPDRGERRS